VPFADMDIKLALTNAATRAFIIKLRRLTVF
jgi:hypothetical protein